MVRHLHRRLRHAYRRRVAGRRRDAIGDGRSGSPLPENVSTCSGQSAVLLEEQSLGRDVIVAQPTRSNDAKRRRAHWPRKRRSSARRYQSLATRSSISKTWSRLHAKVYSPRGSPSGPVSFPLLKNPFFLRPHALRTTPPPGTTFHLIRHRDPEHLNGQRIVSDK